MEKVGLNITPKEFKQLSKWAAFVHECYYCNSSLIKQACRGKQKTSYGYHWEFVKK